jgi:predicted transposase/invertase (TIGR01784 family)
MPRKPGLTHDGYFKRHLNRLELAKSFFQNFLPTEILQRIQWDTLQLASGDFVDKALKNKRTDILYEVRLSDRKCFLYLHLEHQRTVVKHMAFRVLGYVYNIWEQYTAQHPKSKDSMPLIFPMVVYQGKEHWTAPQSLHELLDIPDFFKAYCPQMSYDLLDLSHLSDNEIRTELLSSSALSLFLLLMKHIDSPEINDLLSGRLLPLVQELFKEKSGIEYIRDMLYYLASKSSHLDEEKTIEALNKIPQTDQTEEYIMTLIETWQQKGYEKGITVGIEKGIEKERVEMISKLLKRKFSTEADSWIQKLQSLNLDQLEIVAERILFSNSLSEIFEGLIH